MTSYQRDERVSHIPTGKYGTVQVVAKDGTWAVVRFDGVKHGRKVPQEELRPLSCRPTVESPGYQEGQLIVEIDRASFYLKGHLCDTCRHATAVECPYLGATTVEEGIAQTGCHVVMIHPPDGLAIYKVQECRRYERGDLPPIKWLEVVLRKVSGKFN